MIKSIKYSFLLKLSLVTKSIIAKTSSIGKLCRIHKTFLSDYSYCSSSCVITYTQIGRYCSIGPSVKVIAGLHNTRDLSTSSIFHGLSWSKESAKESIDFFQNPNKEEIKICAKGAKTKISDDVWIGADVKIFSGVKIGRGAVIGACALITKDVDPYTIVGGVPAKVLRKRFSKETIDWLEKTKWWNLPPKEASDLFKKFPSNEK